jgi:hypothetical protein
MLLAMPLVGLILGYALGGLRIALLATAAAFAAGTVVVVIADNGILDDGGAFYLSADIALSLGLAWLGVALRERRVAARTSG